MVAIIVDALRAVPRGWTEGAAALGVNRWRAMWTVSRARRAPGDRRRRRARHARARSARRSCSRWSRARVGFAPNPLDGLTFLFEPLRPLAATIVDNAEGLSRPAVRPDDLRVRAAAALLEPRSSRSPAGLAKQPLKQLRDAASDGRRAAHRAAAAAASAAQAPRQRVAAHVALERPHRASCCAGPRASRCALIAAAIVLYMAVKGVAVPAASTCSSTRPQPALDQSKIGRLPRPDRRHAACSR